MIDEQQMGSNFSTLLISALLPLSYVSLVHLFDLKGVDRNDSNSIKKRFFGAIISNIISISLTYRYLSEFTSNPYREMGFRLDNIGQAITYPFVLITSLYFGQFVMMYIDKTLWHYLDYYEWRLCFKNLRWIRDIIMGPITEEIAFRCCSAVLMNQCIGKTATILISPLPFAASHFHHVLDDQRKGHSLAHSILQRAFQFCYTYVFGAFATYLQLTTKHAIVPIVTHSLCNAQGLPLVHEIENYPKLRDRFTLWFSYSSGFSMFLYLLNTQYGMPTPINI